MGDNSSRVSARAGGRPVIEVNLTDSDKAAIAKLMRGQAPATTVLRARLLQLASEGKGMQEIAAAVGLHPNTVVRTKARYIAGGLERALWNQPRGKSEPLLDDKQEQRIVAMLCGPSPTGRARWSVRLARDESIQRGIVPKVGRETIRVLMAECKIKPWREKNVVHPGTDAGIRREDGESS